MTAEDLAEFGAGFETMTADRAALTVRVAVLEAFGPRSSRSARA